jgi:5-methylcytosine-specific restriction endonuclease McrA
MNYSDILKKAWITRRKNGNDVPWNKGKKGSQVAWNKGIKGIMKPNSGSFKKGHTLLKGFYRQLDVHHIDYDKDNLSPNNLITLCRRCHVKTNNNRDFWRNYFVSI